jgi:hypothetical protein
MESRVLDAFANRGVEAMAYLMANAISASAERTNDHRFNACGENPMANSHPTMMTGPLPAQGYMQQLQVTAADAVNFPLMVTVPFERETVTHQSRVSFSHGASQNPSFLSHGNGFRHASMTNETTFGRAMSGLSVLSIDWENLDDFDLEVDHSAHINNQARPAGSDGQADNTKHAVGV